VFLSPVSLQCKDNPLMPSTRTQRPNNQLPETLQRAVDAMARNDNDTALQLLNQAMDEDPPCVRIVVAPIEPVNPGAAMKDRSGTIRTSIQRQVGGEIAAA